jgi:hypothetical protein
VRVDHVSKELMMSTITGRLYGQLVKVQDHASWKNLELVGCMVAGGPTVRFGHFERVMFVNCIFLYDGMEVDGAEWLAFMSREKVDPTRAQRRPH